MSRNYYNINLTKLELGNIEFYLNNRKNFTIIGKILNKDGSTIRKEVKNILHIFAKLENVLIVLIKIIITKNIYLII